MAKSNEKAAGQNKTENQRGKGRFASQSRPGRVVLPSRPPREVDNEIVSILLGGDPIALAPQGEYEVLKASTAPTPPVANLEQEAAIPVEQSLPLIDEERSETLPVTPAPKPIKQIPPPTTDRLDGKSFKADLQPNENLRLQERPITSFKDLSDRWKHGLRKGQLKICEVLNQQARKAYRRVGGAQSKFSL